VIFKSLLLEFLEYSDLEKVLGCHLSENKIIPKIDLKYCTVGSLEKLT